jgi:hypothetical protein
MRLEAKLFYDCAMAGLTVSLEKYARLLFLDVLGSCAFTASQVVKFLRNSLQNYDFPEDARSVPNVKAIARTQRAAFRAGSSRSRR